METWGKDQHGFMNLFFSSISSSISFCPSFRFWSPWVFADQAVPNRDCHRLCKSWSQWIRSLSGLSRPVELEFNYLNNKRWKWSLESLLPGDLQPERLDHSTYCSYYFKDRTWKSVFLPGTSHSSSIQAFQRLSQQGASYFSRTSQSQQLCFAPMSNTVRIMSQNPYSSSPFTREALVFRKAQDFSE